MKLAPLKEGHEGNWLGIAPLRALWPISGF
jgi:hypothetical protein